MSTLILGCGPRHHKLAGEITLDVRPFPGVDLVHDLNLTPWPLADGQFLHASAIHVVEHLDNLVAFMNEAWRVLQLGGSLYLETPEAGADPDLQWADPTHRRCYRRHTFINYFTREGIERFGYTDRPWAVLDLKVVAGCIHFHASPIKT